MNAQLGLRYRSTIAAILTLLITLALAPPSAAAISRAPAPEAGGCASGGWTVPAVFEQFVAQDLAVSPTGALFLTGVEPQGDGTTLLATARSTDGGESWEWVDVFSFYPDESAGGHALYAAPDGAVYALGWAYNRGQRRLVLRKSESGAPRSWWTSNEWNATMELGALTGDTAGEVYVVLGYAGPAGKGWVLQSAFEGEGAWTEEDDFQVKDPAVYSVYPLNAVLDPDHGLLVTGQLNGDPDRWVVRHQESFGAPWRTIDLYAYSGQSYGLAAATAAFAAGGDGATILVAGYGVQGGTSHDYRWLVRRAPVAAFAGPPGEDPWKLNAYQLQAGRSSFGLDTAVDGAGQVLVAGTAGDAGGTNLVIRRSVGGGEAWQDLLVLPGVTSDLDAAVAVGPDGRYWATGIVGDTTVLVTCQP